MPLKGSQLKQIQQALLSAFPSRMALDRLIRFEINEHLEAIAGTGKLEDVVFALINWAEAHGRMEELVEKARATNPGNLMLKSVSNTVFMAPDEVWSREASEAAQYVNNHLFSAHRGAILWCPNVTAIFGNDGFIPQVKAGRLENSMGAQDEVANVKDALVADGLVELGFGLSKESYSWAILVASARVKELHDLVWMCWRNTACSGSDEYYIEVQELSAFECISSYWNDPHKPNCPPNLT